MLEDTLKLVLDTAHGTPCASLPRSLDALFASLAQAESAEHAASVEDEIWAQWLHYPQPLAREALERAEQAIAGRDFEQAGRLLDRIVEDFPDYAEAWNKRATLRFLQGRDSDSVHDIGRTLMLEPRHFGAICGFAQICLRQDRGDLALFALQRAHALHPTMDSVNEAIAQLATRTSGPAH
ncbi:MAG: hypothetical protein IT532_01345 [Burkholderiales bacterium]|nr:hypothetical protein [Burkholderiales bacterium]